MGGVFGSCRSKISCCRKHVKKINYEYDPSFGGPYTNKLTYSDQKLVWNIHTRHSVGMAMMCPTCGGGSTSYCKCRRQRFFDELSDDEIQQFHNNKQITCKECYLNMNECDCKYKKDIEKILKELEELDNGKSINKPKSRYA